MADPNQLALLKRSVVKWNEWRRAHRIIKVDLSRADLSYAQLAGADLSHAQLTDANLSYAQLAGVDLSKTYFTGTKFSGANLGGAKFGKTDLGKNHFTYVYADFSRAEVSSAYLSRVSFHGFAHRKDPSDPTGRKLLIEKTNVTFREDDLSGADLSGADLSRADLSRANLKDAILDTPSSRSIASKSQPPPSPSPTDWLSLVRTYGGNLLLTAATLASIIQGLDVVERRWREHQEKHKQQGAQTSQPASTASPQLAASPSSKTSTSDKEIVEILLVMDDGSQHAFKRWISDPDALKAYIDAFSDPTSKVKPLQVVFRKLGGRALVVDVTKEGKDNKQLNAILEYLDADPL